ncbi:2-C-methyl-D-erythritol 4-phosphate cytidylyltransferase [Saccharomonospora piscinae]|uniref:2-C-methyl-D-erythritol 4-phosphate cytidylyltransferase n=1 Tax=Saccharomonospora piscinae TaxID=687388 RepID=A0A1V8ZWM7_SACPI|nr:IspD/TarI family cytidylyltransferase [Saccharomonospora piscinae]OQO89305.1 2-C-methyl-D-erythritol 4-phosphate cytidylyltransferase [Saccharomonospora piscinae]
MAERVPGAAGVVLASGAGTRVGAATNKVYLPLAGRAVVSWSLRAFARVPGLDTLVLVTRPDDDDLVRRVLSEDFDGDIEVEVVHGGSTRQRSELAALRHLRGRIESGAIDVVLLHDGARPLVGTGLIAEVLRVARERGGALPALRDDDLVALAGQGGQSVTAVGDDTLVRAQTPQGFRAAAVLAAYERAEAEGFVGTDTASCMERFGGLPVRWVAGEERNIKVTYPHDLALAERVLAPGE